MICRVKKTKKGNSEVKNDVYFVKFLFFNTVKSKNDLKPIKLPVCDWSSDISKAKVFKTKKEAEKKVKQYNLKNVEYERVN